ncbi:hypothetical protein JHK84_055929 [Glycine max]|nr:hypothetical protein JHK85_056908 [Glycine max]KAG5074698.1 hypothetical protein JHK84_055929 [Glycine max]
MRSRVNYLFPEEVLEHMFSFIDCDKDRSLISLVCKSWYEIERWCRRRVFVENCYIISSATIVNRFPKVRSITIKGKLHFADFNLVPEGWGIYEIKLKRMVISNECLKLIAKSFKNI